MFCKELTRGKRKVLITTDHKGEFYHLHPFFYIPALADWMSEDYKQQKEILTLREAKKEAEQLLKIRN